MQGDCDMCGDWAGKLTLGVCSSCISRFHGAEDEAPAPGRPVRCRNRLRDEGRAYPKSGCEVCQTGGIKGCPYEPAPVTDIQLLAHTLAASVATRKPDLIIGPEDNPYLIRYWLRRDRTEGSIYLHWIYRDDDDRALHDHPWPSTSIVLQGTLREVLPDSTRLLEPGSITSRSAEQAHRLEVVDGPVLTLFITGAVQREWGFHCPNGWVHWKDFTKPENPGEIGKGCGE